MKTQRAKYFVRYNGIDENFKMVSASVISNKTGKPIFTGTFEEAWSKCNELTTPKFLPVNYFRK
jgi:hypothetical protein